MAKRLTTEEFVRRSMKLYGNKFDYSKVEYKGLNTKVCIICPTHGEFSVWPSNFMRGHGCPACNGRERITAKVFIKRAKLKHNNRYEMQMQAFALLSAPSSFEPGLASCSMRHRKPFSALSPGTPDRS